MLSARILFFVHAYSRDRSFACNSYYNLDDHPVTQTTGDHFFSSCLYISEVEQKHWHTLYISCTLLGRLACRGFFYYIFFILDVSRPVWPAWPAEDVWVILSLAPCPPATLLYLAGLVAHRFNVSPESCWHTRPPAHEKTWPLIIPTKTPGSGNCETVKN